MPELSRLPLFCRKEEQVKIHLDGLLGSAVFSFVIRSLFKHTEAPFLIVLIKRKLTYPNDLEQMVGEQDVLFYPGSAIGLIKLKIPIMPMFTSLVLNQINSHKKNQQLSLS
jgi:transcription-repair coupling factor (superfamily II helicase)